jgi:formylglycine-generating enzyme
MNSSGRLAMAVAGLAGVLCASRVCAAGLDPTNAPGPTMHSLEEIYAELLATRAEVAANRERIQEFEQRMATDGMGDTVAGMALIPAGPFLMGDCFGESSMSERPVHTVTVSAVYMDVYEITSNLWREVYTWAVANSYSFGGSASALRPSHPTQSVTWYDCVKWANARSQRDGLTPCYYTGGDKTTVYRTGSLTIGNDAVRWDANGYRLPTEAEWEKAARGGVSGRRFPWGNANLIDHFRANYNGDPTSYTYDTSAGLIRHPAFSYWDPSTSPVGSFAPNGYGLYDMAGNVNEWCWDWYDNDYYTGSHNAADPRGPGSGSQRVMRGGAFSFSAKACRVADRSSYAPNQHKTAIGFRLVRAAP